MLHSKKDTLAWHSSLPQTYDERESVLAAGNSSVGGHCKDIDTACCTKNINIPTAQLSMIDMRSTTLLIGQYHLC
jgi:hypothetical protein